MPEDPATAEPHEGRNVSGQEADEAARRAIDAEGPSRDDVIDQSAYRDNAADPGQQAADADRAESD